MTYEVGYRRPPKEGQFLKGKSGNPKGRPKGSRNILTLLQDELNAPVTVMENGRRKVLSRQALIVKRLVSDALKSDPKALISLVDLLRRVGQFTEPVEVEELLPADYKEKLARHNKKV